MKWKAVDKKLPVEGAAVLVSTGDGQVLPAVYTERKRGCKIRFKTNRGWNDTVIEDVVFWMAFPTPPRQR